MSTDEWAVTTEINTHEVTTKLLTLVQKVAVKMHFEDIFVHLSQS